MRCGRSIGSDQSAGSAEQRGWHANRDKTLAGVMGLDDAISMLENPGRGPTDHLRLVLTGQSRVPAQSLRIRDTREG